MLSTGVFNYSNQTSYTGQKYVPLSADDINSETSQDTADGVQLTVWWNGQDHSNGYIIVMGDSCVTQGRDPGPCFIVQNTVRL